MRKVFSSEWTLCEKWFSLGSTVLFVTLANCFVVLELGKFLGLQDYSFLPRTIRPGVYFWWRSCWLIVLHNCLRGLAKFSPAIYENFYEATHSPPCGVRLRWHGTTRCELPLRTSLAKFTCEVPKLRLRISFTEFPSTLTEFPSTLTHFLYGVANPTPKTFTELFTGFVTELFTKTNRHPFSISNKICVSSCKDLGKICDAYGGTDGGIDLCMTINDGIKYVHRNILLIVLLK